MDDNDSGGFLVVIVFWLVIAALAYKIGPLVYRHFLGMEVHSKTVVAVKLKNVGMERVYDENGKVKSNQVNATVNVPIGVVSVRRKWALEQSKQSESSLPFTNAWVMKLNISTTVSTNSEPVRYSRMYDQNGMLVGHEVATDLFGYSREYCLDGQVKSETLSAGLNTTIGPVDLQCRRVWTFTKPQPRKYPFPPSDNWKLANLNVGTTMLATYK